MRSELVPGLLRISHGMRCFLRASLLPTGRPCNPTYDRGTAFFSNERDVLTWWCNVREGRNGPRLRSSLALAILEPRCLSMPQTGGKSTSLVFPYVNGIIVQHKRSSHKVGEYIRQQSETSQVSLQGFRRGCMRIICQLAHGSHAHDMMRGD